MKELGEIYWEIHHKWYEESLSLAEQMTLLHKAAEEYVENLLKYGERWKSILKYDLDLLEVSSQCRKEVEGYSDGAKIFRNYIFGKLKRYGLNNDDIRIPKNSEKESLIDRSGENENQPDVNHWNDVPIRTKRVFMHSEVLFSKYSNLCKGKSLKDIAYLFDQSKEVAKDHGWKKALFDYFVWPDYKDSQEKYDNVIKRFYNGIRK